MSVTIQCESGGIVTGILLNCFYVVSGPKGVDHIGVTKVVKAMIFQARFLKHFL